MFWTYGPHRVTNYDVFDDAWLAMIDDENISMVYSDPPWGDGNMKYWRTINSKTTGHDYNAHSFQQLIERLMTLAKRVERYMCIETGLRFVEQWEGVLANEFPYLEKKSLVYSSKNLPNVLFISGRLPIPDIPCDGMKGYPIVKMVVSALAEKEAIILDPCCGMGYTAQAAIDTGMHFRGNEFNAARLEKTKERLQKAIGHD